MSMACIKHGVEEKWTSNFSLKTKSMEALARCRFICKDSTKTDLGEIRRENVDGIKMLPV